MLKKGLIIIIFLTYIHSMSVAADKNNKSISVSYSAETISLKSCAAVDKINFFYATDSITTSLTDINDIKEKITFHFNTFYSLTAEPKWKYHKVGNVNNKKNITDISVSFIGDDSKIIPYETLVYYKEKTSGIDGHGAPVDEPEHNNFLIYVFDKKNQGWKIADEKYYEKKLAEYANFKDVRASSNRKNLIFFILSSIIIFLTIAVISFYNVILKKEAVIKQLQEKQILLKSPEDE